MGFDLVDQLIEGARRMSQVHLANGDVAPDFILPDAEGASVSLSDFRGRKVIVYFYPAAATPGCTTQACDFRDNFSSLNRSGFAVVGVSKDSPEVLRAFAEAENLTFPLLSDSDLSVHHSYGAWGEKSMYGKRVTGVLRSTFVIDEDGVVLHALHNVKATGHVAALRKKLGLSS